GGGKTTMTSFLETLFHETGKSCASLSLDDVYLTRSEQVAVAQSNPGNPLLEAGVLALRRVQPISMGNDASLNSVDLYLRSHLKPVNAALRDFDQLYAELSALIVVQVEDLGWVYTWREQAEARMREEGKPAMTPEQVKDFVDRFMPAYERYLPQLNSDSAGPSSISRIPRLTVTIGQHRECTSVVAREGRNA
ncbi:unnamed protein product, partial [Aphanomyces euteiches]